MYVCVFRWEAVVREVTLELQRAQVELHLWQEYSLLYNGCSEHLSHHWEQYESFLSLLKKQEYTIELLHDKIDNISVSDSGACTLQTHNGKNIQQKQEFI